MHSVGQLTRCSKILTLKIKSITYSWTGNSATLLHLLLHVAPISCHLAVAHWYCVAEHTECQTVSNVHARFAVLSCSVLYCETLACMISNLLLAMAKLGLSHHESAQLSAYFAHFALCICTNQIALMTSLTCLQRGNQLH